VRGAANCGAGLPRSPLPRRLERTRARRPRFLDARRGGALNHAPPPRYFKWCKGCKKFLHVFAFEEKLSKCTTKYSKQPSKCDRCRERGRQSYMSKRLDGASAQAAAGKEKKGKAEVVHEV